jgi:hypothetical protein
MRRLSPLKLAPLALALLVTVTFSAAAGSPPGEPTNVTAYLTGATVLLTWQPPPEGDAVLYNVYGLSSSGYEVVATTASTGFALPQIYEGYGVSALSIEGLESAMAQASCIQVDAGEVPPVSFSSSCGGGVPVPSDMFFHKSETAINVGSYAQ